MATITGKWRWNDTIEGTEDIQDLRINIRFDSGGRSFYGIEVDKGVDGVYRLAYMPYTGSTPIVFQSTWNPPDSTMQLSLEEYRIIDFRRDILSIDQDAYEFIVANAEPFYDIADKLRRVINNVDTVYYSGKSAGREAGKREGYEVGKAEGLEEGYDNGYQEGLVSGEGYENGYSKAESDFWDVIQESGKRTEYTYAFSRWADEYIRPKYKVILKNAGSQKNMFYMNKYVKKIEAAYFDLSQLPRGTNDNQSFSYCFTSSSALEEIEDIGMQASYSYAYAFAYCAKLKKIAMVRVDETTQGLGNAFSGCHVLESVTFEGVIGISINLQWCTKLNLASMQNIVDCLAEGVSGKTLTLSKDAVDAIQGVSGGDFVTPSIGTGTVEWMNIQTEAQRKGWDIVLV